MAAPFDKLDEDQIGSLSEQLEKYQRSKRLRSSDSDDLDAPEVQERTLAAVETLLSNAITPLMLKLDNQEKKLDHLTKTFESQTAAIKNVQSELNILRQENHAKIENLKNDIKKQGTEFKTVKDEVKSLRAEVAELQADKSNSKRKLIDLEARGRRNNLLFFGIPEDKEEKAEEVLQKFIKDELKINSAPKFQRVHRLGRKAPSPNIGRGKPRPIIACFNDFVEKENVRSKRYDLRAPLGMAEDFPLEIREARKSIASRVNEIRKSGKKVAIGYPCKLYVGNVFDSEVDVTKFSST